MSSRINAWLAFPVLLVGATASASGQENWEPYDFRHTKYMEFAVSSTSAGANQSGTTIMEFTPQGGEQVQLRFAASLGDMSSEFTTTAPETDVFGQALAQIMMSPAGELLMATLLAPTWGMYFMGQDLSVGSGWSFSELGKSQSMKVEAACRYAGQEGVEIVWRESDAVRSRICVDKSVPLPLSMTLVTEEGQNYQLELKKYERR